MALVEPILSGDPRRKALDHVRARLIEIDGEIERTRSALLPVDEAVEQIVRSTDEAMDDIRTQVRWASQAQEPGRLDLVHRIVSGDTTIHQPINPLAVMRWQLGDDAFRAMLRERVGSVLDDLDAGLPRADRPTAIADLEAERSTLLDNEELETMRLERDGFVIDRRAPESAEDVDRLLESWAVEED